MSATDRSHSRGRDVVTSTGRGGAGNIRSVSRDAKHDDDVSNPRGREFAVSPNVLSSGRGGAGNIRSPSHTRTPSAGPTAAERDIIAKHAADDADHLHSVGRGGAGNIKSTSRSRSRGPNTVLEEAALPPLHSSGRGGVGNMTRDGADGAALAGVETAEIIKHQHSTEGDKHLHSTGRGGLANMTTSPQPHDAKLAHHSEATTHPHSTGRGGIGNFHSNHPEDTTHDERGREKHKGPLTELWEKVRDASSSRSRSAAAHGKKPADHVSEVAAVNGAK